MKRSTLVLLLAFVGMVAIFMGTALTSVEAADYVGVKKCKMCHSSAKLGGEQYKAWSASKHAKTLDLLKGDDAKNPKCLKCHTTGYGKSASSSAVLSGVQCEACHGPGSGYKSSKIMSKKVYAADAAAAREKAIAAGMIIPDENTCKGCHNEESPQFKGFDFSAASEKIKHWK